MTIINKKEHESKSAKTHVQNDIKIITYTRPDVNIEKAKNMSIFEKAINSFHPFSENEINISTFILIRDISLAKDKRLTEMLINMTTMAFKYGYINGYRHVRDYGLGALQGEIDIRPIDVAKQIEEIERIELFKKLFNHKPI